MEDHHHHNHQRHHDHNPIHEYGITDLRHLIENGARPPPPPPIPSLSPAPPPASLETLMMMGRPISAVDIMPQLALHHHHQYGAAGGGGLEADTGGGGDCGTGRWPRQETLTLLEIRSRLDCKFKEANQKGPLWDEVSRIMSEEHGYQRSGKKCREKFENLYKYYKKTKEGKAGRQDGKHYRFFRQLEALYGETSNNNNNQISLVQDSHNYNMANNLGFHAIPMNMSTQEGFNTNTTNNNNNNSLSLSNNSSEFESSSSDEGNESSENKNVKRNSNNGNRTRSSRGSWKAKIKDFIDLQMRKLMEKQEAWLEKLMTTLEQKEKERSLREEEWRRQEASRVEREHRFWAKKRAWIEARDSALMEALKNLTGKDQELALDHDHNNNDNYKVVNALLSPRPELGLNPNGADDQDGSEIHENVNLGTGGRDHDRDDHHGWAEAEVSRLIQLRTSMESRFEQGGFPEEVLWEDIAAKMACLGYDRNGLMCREKWESVNTSSNNNNNNNNNNSKKRKENSRECGYGTNFHNNNESSTSLYNHGGYENCDQLNNDGTSSSPSNANVGNTSSSSHHHHHHHHHQHHHHQVVSHDSCFPFLMGEGSENLWENYGLKINKGGQN